MIKSFYEIPQVASDVIPNILSKTLTKVGIKNNIMNPENNKFSDVKIKAADLDKNGTIKASDYVLIKNYIMYGTEIQL